MKYTDEAVDVAKQTDNLIDLAKQTDNVIDAAKQADNAIDAAKQADNLSDASKQLESITDSIGEIKHADEMTDGVKQCQVIPQSKTPLDIDGDIKICDDSKETKPYANSRPSYGKNQVNEVWENAMDPVAGKVYDPSGVEITWDRTKPRNGQWDMGHIPTEKYSDMHQLYMDGIISKEEFLEWYRDPKNYRPELPSTNRGHRYE